MSGGKRIEHPTQREMFHQRCKCVVFSLLLLSCGVACRPDKSDVSNSHNAAIADSSSSSNGAIRVAAASDLKFALDEILQEYRKVAPATEVSVVYGSSGSFFAQLSNDAPFDVFLSADIQYPRKLIEKGQAIADSEFQYAQGHVVVWVPNASPLQVKELGMEVLLDPAVKKIAIADPEVAPYGRAAKAALQHFELYDRVQDRLVLGENVSQTAQFVESGSADAGIFSLSLALAPSMKEKGRYWEIPVDAYPPLEQGGVILENSKQKAAAEKFCEFLQGEQARAVLARYGFILPGKP